MVMHSYKRLVGSFLLAIAAMPSTMPAPQNVHHHRRLRRRKRSIRGLGGPVGVYAAALPATAFPPAAPAPPQPNPELRRDLFGFLSGGADPAAISHANTNTNPQPQPILPQQGSPNNGHGGGSGSSNAKPPASPGGSGSGSGSPPGGSGTKKPSKEKMPLLEGVLSTILEGGSGGGSGGGGGGSRVVIGGMGSTVARDGLRGTLTSSGGGPYPAATSFGTASGGVEEGILYPTSVNWHSNGLGAIGVVGSIEGGTLASLASTGVLVSHFSISASGATSTPTASATVNPNIASTNPSSSNAPKSELTEWKVIGVAVISVTFIGILMLLITFFDSWWAFLKDVSGCGGAGWGCCGGSGVNGGDEADAGREKSRGAGGDEVFGQKKEDSSKDLRGIGKPHRSGEEENGWSWQRLSQGFGRKSTADGVDGDWWRGKHETVDPQRQHHTVDWYAYAYTPGDADAVPLQSSTGLAGWKGESGPVSSLGSSVSIPRAYQHQQQGILVPGLGIPSSRSREAVPVAIPVQVQIQPPTPTTPPLPVLPTLPSAGKLRQFLTGSPSQPGYPPFQEDPYVVGEVLRRKSAKRGSSKLKNVSVPPV